MLRPFDRVYKSRDYRLYGGPYVPNRQRPKFASSKCRPIKISPYLTTILWRAIRTKRLTARNPETLCMKALHTQALYIEALYTEALHDALHDALHNALHNALHDALRIKDFAYRGSAYRGSVYKDSIYRGFAYGGSTYRGF